MKLAKIASWLPFVALLAGCELVSGQYPSAPNAYPPQPGVSNSGGQSSTLPQTAAQQTQVTGAQRGQYAWDKALEGMMIGASLMGPYGAGGGLVIGLLAGLFTADGHYTQINTQIQSEQAKDKELEAKIEQELESQRELEAKLTNVAGNPAQQNQAQAAQSQPAQWDQKPKALNGATVNGTAINGATAPANQTSMAVASLNKKENSANSSSSPASPFKNVEVRDINGDGIPDLWIYYNALKPGEIVRQEEASHWDGTVDTWSYFKDGKLVRREVDKKGKGTADTVYYYENDKILKEERDENGTGNVSYRAIYQDGRRAKVEEDTTGSGKTDLWTYYDTTHDGEIILKQERDLNGDGVVDLWSYYENGRLVRRDLSAVGLELVSKQDQLPSSPADLKNIPGPQLVRENQRPK